MPDHVISEETRLRLAQSMPIVERRRAPVTTKLQEALQSTQAFERMDAGAVASRLFDLLLDGGSDIAAFGSLRNLSAVRDEHLILGVSGRHYSAFGLALEPSLAGVIGPALPRRTICAWCDTFWLLVRALGEDEQRGSPSPRRGLAAVPAALGRAFSRYS